jgi:menaquinol-cytochrome c reductase iron-sulfur subunit
MLDRRTCATGLLALGGTIASCAVGIPAILAAFSASMKGRRGGAWRSAGQIDDFEHGKIVATAIATERGDWSANLAQQTVYVWRQAEKEFVVYSRSCTDLSCPVTFDPGSECFFCPCHGGIFAKNGKPLAGPPKLPLYRYANRIRNGNLEIDLYSLPPAY